MDARTATARQIALSRTRGRCAVQPASGPVGWEARRFVFDFGAGMDARTAWVMARLARHRDDHGYAMAHLDDERRAID
ncbi:hypothetical protein [Streptomyces erythrochromogenes]|uniref:hypothetical protein n=1 Tax=Streptomyces erythrochromogenes TaxID=285574 RepID=UPI00367486E6